MSGGTFNIGLNGMTIAARPGANSVATISGGSFNSTSSTVGGIYVGEQGTGVLNFSGSASLTLATTGLQIARGANVGIANLLGGTVNTNIVQKGTSGNATATINLNGGTLKVNGPTNAATFMQGLNNAFVYPGGGCD